MIVTVKLFVSGQEEQPVHTATIEIPDDKMELLDEDGTEALGLSIDENFAIVLRLDSGEDFHECAFAGPVFSDDGEDFTGEDFQADALQSPDAGKRLDDVADFEAWRGG